MYVRTVHEPDMLEQLQNFTSQNVNKLDVSATIQLSSSVACTKPEEDSCKRLYVVVETSGFTYSHSS